MPAAQWLKRIDAFYQEQHNCGQHFPKIWAIDLSDWARTIERIAQDMHDGKLKPGELDEAFIRDTHAELSTAARQGWGKDWAKPEKATGLPADNVVAMQQNIWRFAHAKDFAMQVALSGALTRNGKITPWADFKAYALKLNAEYNLNHLEAEYRTARQAGHMAAQWDAYERGKDTYPNLKYMTQRDEKVREEHQALQDIIAPVGHDFWNRYYPPNGWRCRCYVVQTAEPATEKIPEDVPDVKPQFRVNVGKGGQVFSEGNVDGSAPHPHFALAKETGGENFRKQFELSKRWAPANEVHRADNGATVDVSIWADKKDTSRNVQLGIVMADVLGINVTARAHCQGEKNPEYEFDGGILGDRVSPTSPKIKTAVSNAFRDKYGKDGQLTETRNSKLVFDIWFEDAGDNVSDFASQAWSKFKNYENVGSLILVKGKKAVEIPRAVIKEGAAAFHQKIKSVF